MVGRRVAMETGRAYGGDRVAMETGRAYGGA